MQHRGRARVLRRRPKKDASGLEKPLAIVVLKSESVAATEEELIAFAKAASRALQGAALGDVRRRRAAAQRPRQDRPQDAEGRARMRARLRRQHLARGARRARRAASPSSPFCPAARPKRTARICRSSTDVIISESMAAARAAGARRARLCGAGAAAARLYAGALRRSVRRHDHGQRGDGQGAAASTSRAA